MHLINIDHKSLDNEELVEQLTFMLFKVIYMSRVVRKPFGEFPTRPNTNRAVQSQQMARVLIFIKYRDCTINEAEQGADALHRY